MYDEEKEKDKILQQVNDILEQYDWGGMGEKVVIRLRFKGKFWMMDPDVRVVEKLDKLSPFDRL